MRHANRDADHLNTLRQYFAQNRRIPSYQRIADLLGFASRAAAVKFMGRMEAEGFVLRTAYFGDRDRSFRSKVTGHFGAT